MPHATSDSLRPATILGEESNNGAEYPFMDRDDLGASKDGRMIFYFGESKTVRIDTDGIVEVVEK